MIKQALLAASLFTSTTVFGAAESDFEKEKTSFAARARFSFTKDNPKEIESLLNEAKRFNVLVNFSVWSFKGISPIVFQDMLKWHDKNKELRLTSLTPEQLTCVIESPELESLNELSITDSNLNDEDVERLIQSPAFKNLTRLCLSRNNIGDEGVIALAKSHLNVTLKSLIILNNPFTERGASEIKAVIPDTLAYMPEYNSIKMPLAIGSFKVGIAYKF